MRETTPTVHRALIPDTAFSRERLAGYDPDRLTRSAALVVGAGALGQNTLINLALSGVGELRIVDHDIFEPHNSTRSPCYPTLQEQHLFGMLKAPAVASRITALMRADRPRVCYATARIQELGYGAFDSVRVVISCVDNAQARAYLADATRLLKLPLIEGGFHGPDVSLSCYPATADPSGVCWRCSHQDVDGVFSCRFSAAQAEAEQLIPAIQAAAATLAGLQAEAAIMALHGDFPLGGRVLDLNVRTGLTRTTALARDPACPGVHRSLPRRTVRLRTSVDHPAFELVAEVEETLGQHATIRLPSPFVDTAPCMRCPHLVAVQRPLWDWATAPYCSACGGTQPRLPGSTDGGIAAVVTEIDRFLPRAILSLSPRVLGIAPRDRLEAAHAGGSTVLRVPGRHRDLYRDVTTTRGIAAAKRGYEHDG
jgi:adenylyltransferase/sulfurtransferase